MLLRVSACSSFEHFLRSLGFAMVVCVMLLPSLAPPAGGAVDQVGAGECVAAKKGSALGESREKEERSLTNSSED